MRNSVSALNFQSNCELLSGEIQRPYEYWHLKALHYKNYSCSQLTSRCSMWNSVSALNFQSNCELLSGEIQPPYEYWHLKSLHYTLNSVRNENTDDHVLLLSHVDPWEEEEEAEILMTFQNFAFLFYSRVPQHIHIHVRSSQ